MSFLALLLLLLLVMLLLLLLQLVPFTSASAPVVATMPLASSSPACEVSELLWVTPLHFAPELVLPIDLGPVSTEPILLLSLPLPVSLPLPASLPLPLAQLLP